MARNDHFNCRCINKTRQSVMVALEIPTSGETVSVLVLNWRKLEIGATTATRKTVAPARYQTTLHSLCPTTVADISCRACIHNVHRVFPRRPKPSGTDEIYQSAHIFSYFPDSLPNWLVRVVLIVCPFLRKC